MCGGRGGRVQRQAPSRLNAHRMRLAHASVCACTYESGSLANFADSFAGCRPGGRVTPGRPRGTAPGTPIPMRARRLPWEDLLRRVFADDVLPLVNRWAPHRSVTVFVTDQHLARSLLAALGLTAEPATFAPARDPPQPEFAWDEPA